ncbi:DUF805 domain-containing protein [Buttiauxella selenatireducens]|uniref:DUF805 domain-containing protein n=1 Tax=Buttiauxella selenatireducens TaxID=3073902 RepID=A0ABY9SGH2_9ENTR|nr:DUF805 domain-containing protein [Buttiauxella sp. R73]WMY76058.1 DUF805 domain-containing protein [Buttiauxella sp. R73]
MENKSISRCYLDGWKKCFVYKGNATRKEFWSFIFINILLTLLAGGLSYLWLTSFAGTGDGGMALVWIYYVYLPLRALVPLVLLLPVLSLGIRRMHDIGKSGWWFGGALLINLAVLPAIIIALYFLFPESTIDISGSGFVKGVSTIWNILSIGFPVWLCCKPTKIKDPTSSSDVMN